VAGVITERHSEEIKRFFLLCVEEAKERDTKKAFCPQVAKKKRQKELSSVQSLFHVAHKRHMHLSLSSLLSLSLSLSLFHSSLLFTKTNKMIPTTGL
jgi:hypothetical protein